MERAPQPARSVADRGERHRVVPGVLLRYGTGRRAPSRDEGRNRMFQLEEETIAGAKIKVIGIGGGGCNAVNSMIAGGGVGVEIIAGNTDMQAVGICKAPTKVPLGQNGRGGGANP